jgi:alpha-2-macroglobulin
MQNFSWKKVAIGAVAAAAVVFVIFYFQKAKSKSTGAASINPAFGEYISSYTAGMVNSGSAVRIVLTEDVADSLAVGQETSIKLLDFGPSVSGKTFWLDRRTLEFRPSDRLLSAQVYEVEFYVSKLFENVPADLKTFSYSFQVIPQNFELTIQNVKPYVKTELKRQQVEGLLLTSDYAESANVEKVISAQQDNKALKINWTHTAEPKGASILLPSKM